MKYEPQIQAANIVIRGTFNPAIFAPAWFALNKVITTQEMNAATVEIIHPDVSRFSINPLVVAVVQDSVTVECLQEPFLRASDFILQTFRLLRHTPVFQFGINYQVHFNLASHEQRTKVGRALAPLEPWGSWGAEIEGATSRESSGGLTTLTIQQNRPGGRSGHRSVQVEPSKRLDPYTGVYMSTNDHYELATSGQPNSVEELLKLIDENFDQSISWSKERISQMMDYMSELR